VTSPHDIPLELAEQFGRGNGVLFVGAGLSRAAGLPDWAGLIGELRSEMPDCPPDASYQDVASYYEIEFGRNRLVQRIREKLDTLNLRPTAVHRLLCEIQFSLIVTTNFDDLLEQTFRSEGRPFNTVTRSLDASFWSSDRAQIVKIHGDVAIPESIVITAGDYERFSAERAALIRLLGATLQTRTVLFMGYSVTDPDLREQLTNLRQETGEYSRNLYSIQFEAPSLAVRDLERRGVRVINLKLDGRRPTDVLALWLAEFRERTLRYRPPSVTAQPARTETVHARLADEVMGLFTSTGYSLSRLQRSPLAVDFRAVKFSEGTELCRWIRCVEGSVGSRHIEEALSLREDDPTGEVWVIAYRSGVFTEQARARIAEVTGARALSIAEFYRTMLNLDSYLTRMINEYEGLGIEGLWVDLACEVPQYDHRFRSIPKTTDTFESVEGFLDVWIDTPGRNHISILGDFGTGKSWLCQHYAARLAHNYLSDPEHNRVPFIISLRDRSRGDVVNLQELITSTLVNEYEMHLPGGYQTFQFLNRHDSLILIFDGFDEMQIRMDDLSIVRNFDELAKVVEPEANCKAILTCRSGYFRTDLEEREILAGEGLQRISLSDRPNFEILHLLPFDEGRIKQALSKLVGARAEQYYVEMQRIYDLADLGHRPMLLAMIAATIPKFLHQHAISPAALYEAYTDEWMRVNLVQQRTIIGSTEKRSLMQDLAWDMVRRDVTSIHYSELPRAIQESLNTGSIRFVRDYDHDVRVQSFLQRDAAGYYSFAHKSFMEFFIAQRIFVDICAGDSRRLATTQTSHETDQFIKDMLLGEPEQVAKLINWMNSGDEVVLRVNSAGILAKTGDGELTSKIIDTLKRDKQVRHLYLTAVLFRVLDIKWESAARLAAEQNGDHIPSLLTLPAAQIKMVVTKFCLEALNPRDAVARWFALQLLWQVRDVDKDKITDALAAAAQTETVQEISVLIDEMSRALAVGDTSMEQH
jgi:hypothetical protein